MNRHLFKKTFFFSFAIFALFFFSLFVKNLNTVNADNGQDVTSAPICINAAWKGDYCNVENQLQAGGYDTNTHASLPNDGTWVSTNTGTNCQGAGCVNGDCTKAGYTWATCQALLPTPTPQTPNTSGANTGSTDTTSTTTSTYNDQISGGVTVQQSQTTPTVTISPTINLTITPSTTPNKPSNYSGWLCTYWHYCPSGQNANTTSYQGATITIDSNITVTTDSQGRFEKSVPHVDTHTVTLIVPEGYQLVSPTSATQTFSTTGSNWKTKLRDIKFTIQKSEESTIPTCDPNGDGKQDASDMTILENEWFGGATTKTADCNKDGVVNGLDFQILKDEINGVNIQTSLY